MALLVAIEDEIGADLDDVLLAYEDEPVLFAERVFSSAEAGEQQETTTTSAATTTDLRPDDDYAGPHAYDGASGYDHDGRRPRGTRRDP